MDRFRGFLRSTAVRGIYLWQNVLDRIRRRRGRSLDYALFFLHIPKTGGTSIRMTFYNSDLSHLVYPSRAELESNRERYESMAKFRQKFPEALEKGRRIFFGHYPLREILSLESSKPVKIITIVREPQERLLSHISHLRSMDVPLNSISAILSRYQQMLGDVQFKFLTKTGIVDEFSSDRNQIDLIGLNLDIPGFIGDVNDRFGFCLRPGIHVNKRKSEIVFDDPADLFLCKKMLEKDQLIYNYLLGDRLRESTCEE